MILSRVELPWRIARQPYEHHRALWQLFPDQPAERRAGAEQPRDGFLFRVEHASLGRAARVLVQSRLPPRPTPDVALLGSREFHPQPAAGQRLAFVLTANPIKTIRDEFHDRKPGQRRDTCRVPLLHEEQQVAWLRRRLAAAALVDAVAVLPHAPVFFRVPRPGGRAGKLVTVTFEGFLSVTDPPALVALLENGIGPAKAFGCGLLLVRRAE